MVKSGQGLAGAIVTRDATGALATPSVGPAGVLYVDGVANGASVTVTGTNPYTWSVTLPALTAGQLVQIYITATISTIPTGTFVVWATADTARISDVETDTQDIQARIPAALIGGRIDASAGAMATDVLTAAALAADAGAEIATAVRSELAVELAHIDADISSISSGLTAQETRDAMKLAPTAGSPAAGSVDAHLDSILAYGAGAGSGTGTYTDTVTDGADPLDNVLVQLSTDAAGTNMVYRAYTAANGAFTLHPDPGTYYVWLELAGYSFTQGAQVVVT